MIPCTRMGIYTPSKKAWLDCLRKLISQVSLTLGYENKAILAFLFQDLLAVHTAPRPIAAAAQALQLEGLRSRMALP